MTFSRLLPLSLACLALGACQTTGLSQNAAIPYGITPQDSYMTCDQLQAEFNNMDQIIASASLPQNNNDDLSRFGQQAAQDALSQSGLRGNSWSRSLNNLAGQFGSFGGGNNDNNRQQAETAKVRRQQLLDLAYNKGCIQGGRPQNYQGGYRPY